MAERSARMVVLGGLKWSPRSPLAGKFAAQLLSTGEQFLSVSPWRYDRRESEAERRRLRDEARQIDDRTEKLAGLFGGV